MNTRIAMMIEARDLRRSFKSKEAVAGISFNARRGEIFGLLGPNGAGKTTTIRMLTGQIDPDSGSAVVAGCDVIKDRAQLKERIGVVFEEQNLKEDRQDCSHNSNKLHDITLKIDDVADQKQLIFSFTSIIPMQEIILKDCWNTHFPITRAVSPTHKRRSASPLPLLICQQPAISRKIMHRGMQWLVYSIL